uniref:Uncharacterized protein n=1 Tax=Macaca nemestrina TaxID=9545 RepID=A0A2K6AWD7_MACNE
VGELPVSEGMWENCPLGWVKKKASRTLGPLDFLLQRKRLRLWASEPVHAIKVHSLCPTQAMQCAEGTQLFSPDGPAGSGASIWPAEGAEGLTPKRVPRPTCVQDSRKMSVCSEENAKAGGCTAFPLLLSPLGARMTGREHAHKGPELTTPLRGFGALAQPSPPLGTSTPSAVLLSAAT